MIRREAGALALSRDDDEFRLLVDSALSKLYGSSDFRELYGSSFGAFDKSAREFFAGNSVPE